MTAEIVDDLKALLQQEPILAPPVQTQEGDEDRLERIVPLLETAFEQWYLLQRTEKQEGL